jgi:hypothetical protein
LCLALRIVAIWLIFLFRHCLGMFLFLLDRRIAVYSFLFDSFFCHVLNAWAFLFRCVDATRRQYAFSASLMDASELGGEEKGLCLRGDFAYRAEHRLSLHDA